MKQVEKKYLVIMAILVSLLIASPVHALERDAYTVPLIITYANPETGEMIDGGGNEALGTSMSQSVMQADALVEYDGENYYVSIGIGLMSNISSVDILLQTELGKDEYQSVELTETGITEKDDDVCIHFRFVMSDLSLLISPQLFVDPMGREVQFFVRLDMDKAEKGTSNYLSEMIEEELGEPEVAVAVEATTEPMTEAVTEPTATLTATPLATVTETAESIVVPSAGETNGTKKFILVIAIIVVGLVGAILIRKKKHED